MAMFARLRRLELIPSVTRLNYVAGPLHERAYFNGYQQIHSIYKSRSNDESLRIYKPVLTAKERTSLNKHKQIRFYSENRGPTALALIKDLKHLKSSPMPALVLGVSGLIPFIAAPVYMVMSGSFIASLAYSQVAYGACILSFTGAVRWGMALSDDGVVTPNWLNLGYSVTPSLVAWLALMMPTTFSLATLIFGLGGAAYMDITMWGYPSWFKAMRFLLSLTAILSLWTTLVCKYILSDSSAKQEKPVARKVKEGKKENVEHLMKKENTEHLKAIVTEAVEEEIKPTPGVTIHETNITTDAKLLDASGELEDVKEIKD